MQAIMKTIKPKTCANIMNHIQSILVIKSKREATAIKKLITENGYADIYVCCSKDKKHKLEYCDIDNGYWSANDGGDYYNGKVVFKFRCYKVERFDVPYPAHFHEIKDVLEHITNESCLSLMELHHYLRNESGYAIYIKDKDLEVFDKPKELYEFKTPENAKRYKAELNKAYDDDQETLDRIYCDMANEDECANAVELTQMTEGYYGLQKAPRSFCYVEAE